MKLTRDQASEIRALRRLKDEQIDLTDIPELGENRKLVVGKFYRPIKQLLTIRIDADVLAWLRSQGKGYQTAINSLLRKYMESQTKKKATAAAPEGHAFRRQSPPRLRKGNDRH